MNVKNSAFRRIAAKLGGLLAAVLATTSVATAQTAPPALPRLSLIASQPLSGFDENGRPFGNGTYYPDDRIWVPQSKAGEDRVLLVPIIIKNCWVTNTLGIAEPIKSFDITLQYDGKALQAVGVQKFGPRPQDTFSHAKNFRLEWSDARDARYGVSLFGADYRNVDGRRIRIVGTSSEPLEPTPASFPNPECDDRAQVELLYVRFLVKGNASLSGSQKTAVILTNDSLRYNERWVREPQFPNSPVPAANAGLDGINNENLPQSNLEPTSPGVNWVGITEIPGIELKPNTGTAKVVEAIDTRGAEWRIVDPIFIDSGAVNPPAGVREIDVDLDIASARVRNLRIETDQPWLFVQNSPTSLKLPSDFSSPSRDGHVDFIDRIMGPTHQALRNPTTPQDPVLRLQVICDPSQLPAQSPAGVYTGYVTFSSPDLDESPVRLRVTMVVLRNAIEPFTDLDASTHAAPGRGIKLYVENAINQRDSLTFGTGVFATNGVDSLFGETEYSTPLTGFGARWYPKDAAGNDLVQFGMGDILITNTPFVRRAGSRDIRAAEADTTFTYNCRFEAGSDANYPVVFTWNVNDFPEGARLFVYDVLNGVKRNGVDMRAATSVGNGFYTYTVNDARIKEIIIEYTTPRVEEFATLNKGWNLVSMQRLPANPIKENVYNNALNEPLFFSSNGYYQEPDGKLKFGRGYFVAYGNVLDRTIAGTRVNQVGGPGNPIQVRLAAGWNTIGALSVPLPVDEIFFTQLDNTQPTPTRNGGVYRYVTDRGYEEVSVLTPGYGYWVNVSDNGFHSMTGTSPRLSEIQDPAAEIKAQSDVVSIRDHDGKNASLYIAHQGADFTPSRFDLPPVAPHNLFDVRFATNRYVETVENAVITLQGAQFPLVLQVENATSDYIVVDALTNEVLGGIAKGSNSGITIKDRTGAVKLSKVEELTGVRYDLGVATPNPVSGSTKVNFTVPSAEKVTIELFNSIGIKVATLFNGVASTGVNTFTIDAQALPAGNYTYRMTAGGFSSAKSIVVVK